MNRIIIAATAAVACIVLSQPALGSVSDAPPPVNDVMPAALSGQGAPGFAAQLACAPRHIERAMRARQDAVRFCYERALAYRPGLVGSVSLDLKLAADGTVAGVRVSQNASGDRSLARCLVRTVKRINFPAPGRGACTTTLPFMFGGR